MILSVMLLSIAEGVMQGKVGEIAGLGKITRHPRRVPLTFSTGTIAHCQRRTSDRDRFHELITEVEL